MCIKRVVITGSGVVSPFGAGVNVLNQALAEGRSCVRHSPELENIAGVSTALAAVVPNFDSSIIPRSSRRSMSKATQYAWVAVHEALHMAGLTTPLLGADIGLVAGTTTTSVENMESFFRTYFANKSVEQITAMLFFRTMGHSLAANLAQALGVAGRVIAPAAACSTGLQAVGLGYEFIHNGTQRIMLCGGADEYHPLTSATFSIMNAVSSNYNDEPDKAPRPFDTQRDGIVCAEGAGMFVLEELTSAKQRNAPILAEIVGFATTADTTNLASPSSESLTTCMRLALSNAQLTPANISYVSAHATGTLQGDIAELEALCTVFNGLSPAVSSLKGHLGHTMAASGAIELAACLKMIKDQCIIPTRNLDNPDCSCKTVRLLQKKTYEPVHYIMKNSFALGGINCSLIIKEYHDR